MVKYFPILATVLLDSASLGHILQMFEQRSSAGQSVMAYVMIIGALILWERFYKLRTPTETWAIWSARFGIVFNAVVLLIVLHFR